MGYFSNILSRPVAFNNASAQDDYSETLKGRTRTTTVCYHNWPHGAYLPFKAYFGAINYEYFSGI